MDSTLRFMMTYEKRQKKSSHLTVRIFSGDEGVEEKRKHAGDKKTTVHGSSHLELPAAIEMQGRDIGYKVG